MARSIKLKWSSSRYIYQRHDGIRVRFEVVCSTGINSSIFAYRLQQVTENTTAGYFSHICSPVDMAEFPVNEPIPGQSPEWFRLNYVDIFLRSMTEVENFIEIVRQDVRRLLATLASMDTLLPRGIDVLGIDCDPDEEPDPDPSPPSESVSYGDIQEAFATGTTEQFVGTGVTWSNVGDGAGSPVGAEDSFGSNSSRVVLQAGQSSSLLLVQGFDFSNLPDDCVIEGIQSQVTLRDATDGAVSDENVLGSNSASEAISATCPHLSLLALQHPDLGMSDDRAGNTGLAGPDWELILRGGDGDRWGFTDIPVAILRDGAFGIGVVIQASNEAGSTVIVDGVKLRVFFRETV